MDLFMSLLPEQTIWADQETSAQLQEMQYHGLVVVVHDDDFSTGYQLSEKGQWQQGENRQADLDTVAFDNSRFNR